MKLVNKSPGPVALSTIAIGAAFKYSSSVYVKTDAVDSSSHIGYVDLATGALAYLDPVTTVEVAESELSYL